MTVPLLPRRRLVGSAFGGYTSVRRGSGTDVAGSRPYQPGDHFHAIDWKASARLSAARASDEFVVRDRYAEEMPRVVVVCDRRPEMSLFPPGLPWLQKPQALRLALRLLVASAINQRGLVGYLDYGSHDGAPAGRAFWQAPRAQASAWRSDLVETTREYLDSAFDAPPDNVARSLELLTVVGGSVTTGSFIFVLSDFLEQPDRELWSGVLGHGWDVVPVVIQDPIWEQSFPPLAGVTAPFVDATRSRLLMVRLTGPEAEERREANEARRAALLEELASLGLDPVLVSGSAPEEVHSAFLAWADARIRTGGRHR